MPLGRLEPVYLARLDDHDIAFLQLKDLLAHSHPSGVHKHENFLKLLMFVRIGLHATGNLDPNDPGGVELPLELEVSNILSTVLAHTNELGICRPK